MYDPIEAFFDKLAEEDRRVSDSPKFGVPIKKPNKNNISYTLCRTIAEPQVQFLRITWSNYTMIVANNHTLDNSTHLPVPPYKEWISYVTVIKGDEIIVDTDPGVPKELQCGLEGYSVYSRAFFELSKRIK